MDPHKQVLIHVLVWCTAALLTPSLPSNPGAFVEQETIFNQLLEMTSPQLSNTLCVTWSFKAVIPRLQVTGSRNYTDRADLDFERES